jgi:hypothetical protein
MMISRSNQTNGPLFPDAHAVPVSIKEDLPDPPQKVVRRPAVVEKTAAARGITGPGPGPVPVSVPAPERMEMKQIVHAPGLLKTAFLGSRFHHPRPQMRFTGIDQNKPGFGSDALVSEFTDVLERHDTASGSCFFLEKTRHDLIFQFARTDEVDRLPRETHVHETHPLPFFFFRFWKPVPVMAGRRYREGRFLGFICERVPIWKPLHVIPSL